MAGEGVVGFLLTKLDSFISKNVSLLTGVNTEVQEMKYELERIKALLEDAPDSSIEEVVAEKQVQLWIKDVRDVAYDIEDVVDKFTLKLENDSPKRLKIAKRLRMGKKLKDIKKRLHSIIERKERYLHQWRDPVNDRWQDPRDYFHPESAGDIVGIEDHVKELKEWLMNDSGPPAMKSVVGMAGLGKTTLVKRVYDEVKKCFDCCAWVRVSPSRTIKDEHLRCMMEDFSNMEGVSVREGMDSVGGDRLLQRLQKFLAGKRYVLVLDDIWYTKALVEVRSKLLSEPYCGSAGSKIMVTTRMLNVGSYGEVYRLNHLSLEEARNLFYKRAISLNRPTEPFANHLDDLSPEIVKGWEGLPLAIVLECRLFLESKSLNFIEWKKVHSNLASESSSDSYKYAMRILSFSYSCLPYNLKSCLLHLGIFPEGQFIKRMRLIRIWMAEGFIEGNVYKTMEEVADDYLNELKNHSVIQVAERSDYGRVISYKVHPLMREFILLKSKEVNFCVLSGNKVVSNTKKFRRLSIEGGIKKDDFCDSTLSHVRSFFAFGADKSSISRICLKFKFLKVLDLENAPLESFPESLTELLFLRYLSLENTKIRRLPKSLGKLVNLETLNLKGTFVRDLPRTIVKLQNMRHLLLCHYDMKAPPPSYSVKAVKLPAGIDRLKSLQNLSYIKVNSKRGRITELGKLTQLRRLGVVGVRKKDGRNLCASVANMKNLLSFSVRSAVADELLDLELLETPPPGLQGLYLGGRLKRLPQWILSLQNLAHLTLGWSKFEEDPFPLLSCLPALVELKIIEAYSGEVLSCGNSEGRGFPKLKSLCLRGLPKLESIDVTEGALATLVKLEIRCCSELKTLPPDFERLTKLQELHLYCMPPRFLDDVQRQRTEGRIMSIKSIHVRNSSSDEGWYL